ncbi:MAG: PAS domain S-box protein [Phycisphaerae bacterium]|nr:PAS domain S-box protein [Phycisphaerae bacterium]
MSNLTATATQLPSEDGHCPATFQSNQLPDGYDSAAAMTAPDAVIVVDRAGLIVAWNVGATRVYGYCEGEILGRPWTVLAGADRHGTLRRLHRRACEGVQIDAVDDVHIRKGGEKFDVRVSFSPARRDSSEIDGVVMISRDVTQTNRLLAQAAELQSVIDSLPVLVLYLDVELRVRFSNRSPLRTWVGAAGELKGRHIRDVLGESIYEKRARCFAETLSGRAVDFEYHIREQTGNLQFFQVTLQPDLDAFGGVRGLICVFTDISTVKHSEAELISSEKNLRALNEALPFGIIKADDRGRVYYANRQWFRMMEMKQSESFGEEWIEEVVSEEQAGLREDWRRSFSDVVELNREFRVGEAGRTRWVQLQLRPLFLDSGLSFFGVLRDVTEARAAQQRSAEHAAALEAANRRLEAHHQELEAANRALIAAKSQSEAATRAKSEFLANMSHEIRTPMTAILGFAEMLMLPDTSPDDMREAADTIRRNGVHLLQLINDILDVSKVEAGKLEIESVPCSPHDIVMEVMELMQVRASAKGLTLVHEFRNGLPDAIMSDPTRIRQILLNLVGNAVKFTEVGGVQLVVERKYTGRTGEQLIIEVHDTGIGIDPEFMRTMFEPFSQGDVTTTRHFGGTGLGLTISRRLARLLGGDIHVQSTKNVGSVMTLILPCRPTEQVAETSASRDVVAGGTWETTSPCRISGDELAGCRILFAEDGPDNQRLISRLLTRAGAEVTVVENGLLAVDAVRAAGRVNLTIDVILLDMMMPEMDGYEATRMLRRDGYRGPIIALTASAMQTDRDRCLAAGCDWHASKPTSPRDLIAVVRQFYPRQS